MTHKIAAENLGRFKQVIFSLVAHLLNLDVDLVFVDTTSAYWETGGPDLLVELQDDTTDTDAGGDEADAAAKPAESGRRAFGHSKDFRANLPQAATHVRCHLERRRPGRSL